MDRWKKIDSQRFITGKKLPFLSALIRDIAIRVMRSLAGPIADGTAE